VQKNMLMVWLIGGLVLLLMGVGAWVVVSSLLERSRPRVPVTPSSKSGTLLLSPDKSAANVTPQLQQG
jgi:hypothetical protein